MNKKGETCDKCQDTRSYTPPNQRGTIHSYVCNKCCPHSKGRWQLLEHYGYDNNKWCCIEGCGTIWDDPDRNASVERSTMSREVNEAAKAHAVGKMETDISDVIAGPIESFLAGAEWMRQQFTPHGTDGCRDCETGRATMYVTLEGRCIECHHKRARTSDVSFPNGSSVTFNETAPDDPIRGLSKPVHNHPQSYSTQCVACTQNEDAG